MACTASLLPSTALEAKATYKAGPRNRLFYTSYRGRFNISWDF